MDLLLPRAYDDDDDGEDRIEDAPIEGAAGEAVKTAEQAAAENEAATKADEEAAAQAAAEAEDAVRAAAAKEVAEAEEALKATIEREEAAKAAAEAEEAAKADAERAEAAAKVAAKREEAAKAVQAELLKCVPSTTHCCMCAEPFVAGSTVLLTCCHTVCRACLDTLETPRICPVCMLPIVGNELVVPQNPFVEAALAVTTPCAECAEDEDVEEPHAAVATCAECANALCVLHEGMHKSRKKTKAHAITPLVSTAQRVKCEKHATPLSHYCVTCAQVVCGGCAVMEHQRPQHKPEELAHYVFPLQAALALAQKAGVARQAEVVDRMTSVRLAVQEVAAAKKALHAEATASFAAMEALLRVRLAALLKVLDAMAAEETTELQMDADADLRRWLTLQGGLDLAALTLGPQATALDKGHIAARTTVHLEAVAKAAVEPAPTPIAIQFEVDSGIEKYLQSVGRFVHMRTYGPACVVSGEGVTKAFVETTTSLTITAMTRRKEHVEVGGDQIEVRGVQDDADVNVEAHVTDQDNGLYEVTYTGVSVGQLVLHVALNAQAVQGSPFSVTVANARSFVFTNGVSCYDNQGILYYLATAKGTKPWQNPHDAGIVTAAASSVHAGPISNLVANSVRLFYTKNEANSWVTVDLNTVRVQPRGYVLSDCSSPSGMALCNWRIEASVDGATWTPLKTHTNDATLVSPKFTAYWPIEPTDVAATFSKFRVFQSGKNQRNDDYLACSGFELYGDLLLD